MMPEKKLSKINWPSKERFGSTAGFVDDRLVVCGGYSPEDKAYLNMCQSQSGIESFFFVKFRYSEKATKIWKKSPTLFWCF